MIGTANNNIKIFLLLLLPAIFIYAKSLFFDFSPMDDQWMIIENQNALADWSRIKETFTKPLAGLYFRPLFTISLMIDYQIGKLDAFYFHLTNLLYHIIATVLLYKLLLSLKLNFKIALLFSVLFSVHSINVHAVAWIPGRNDLLLVIFALASVLCLIKYELKKQPIFIFFHLIFFVAALLTKETAIVLPLFFLIILYNIIPLSKKQFMFFLAWSSMVIVWYMLRSVYVKSTLAFTGNLILISSNFIKAIILYIGKCLFPLQQSVFPTLPNSSLITGIISLCLLVIITYIVGFKNKRLAYSGIFIFFLTLSIPTWYGACSTLGEHYEHRAYFPLIGIIIFLTQLNFSIQQKYYNYVMIFIIIAFGVNTYYRLNTYKTKDQFIDAGIKEAPGYFYFFAAKADNYIVKKRYAEAIPYYDKAINMQPKRAQLYSARGYAYTSLGNTKKAIEDFSKAINLSQHPDMYLNRCLVYKIAQDYQSAWKDLEYLKTHHPEIIPNGLESELSEHLYLIALDELNAKIKSSPKNPVVYIQKAKILISKNNLTDALKEVQKAREIEPKNQMFKLYEQQIISRLK